MSNPNSTTKPLRVGVLYEETQMSDLVGLDLLGNLTPKTLNMIAEMEPALAPLKQYAIPIEFLYISSSLELAWTTPEMFVKPTHTYETAPRDLDILLLGGPNPAAVKDESLTFLREASKSTKVILTTCTGAMWLARSGVLDGKKATTNRMMLNVARKMLPQVEWMDQRWVVDEGHFEGAQLWTAGGAGCGIDMFMEYTYQNFDKRVVETGCEGFDFDFHGRSQFYKSPLPSFS
ncbi:class I glutamine amidotransferase-like protein [Cucurbitaria berberidis CBS 394.84]|uniref:Class I glutamine amidotransferase-like protein n=1 Tax=Cucurbitaria berberidis CBS 394.84 TaxID=1168544 RepID=A0A9P4GBD0_9PLEO|nr:class I glutamine amidotransferase-like protein [Cucurbitaria berberidis CBS 394.84]KAF1842431.1 class I glutamine amidotransferase-like protein [Cucurbitaria berberidis CBS 394.84]